METKQDTITVTVDGKQIEARPGELLIEVAKRAGIYIPYFCYHPRMDPVGACRMCLVHVQGPPKPQTACTTRVTDGMVVETQFTNEHIGQAQQGVLEFLLINHPLDCPICDRAGECPLQDQTQDYGPNESRYLERKRRFEKPVKISPLINLDRERCILCYRCTRFCEELSGDVLIGVMERGPEAFIFPFYSFESEEGPDGVEIEHDERATRGPNRDDINQAFDSYFSGNTVQICPVGALTSAEYRFRARPWDLENMRTTCNLCACGCAMYASVRVQDGNVVRFSAATNEETNEEWLCDKGRFGNNYISSPERLTYPYARRGDDLAPVGWDEVFSILSEKLKPVLEEGGSAGMIVGESLCDEDLYAAQKFARLVLKTNNIDHRLEGGLEAETLVRPDVTYDDLLASDLVVLVDLDAREELPILFLRLRIAATKRGVRFAIVHPREVGLSEYAVMTIAPLPGTTGAAGRALAASLSGADAGSAADASGVEVEHVRLLASALNEAERPIIVLGPRAHTPDVVSAWTTVAQAAGARLTWAPRRSNTYGALATGAHPHLLPGWRSLDDGETRLAVEREWNANLPTSRGLDARGILEQAAAGNLDVLWLVGADVLADLPDAELGRRALEGAKVVVVQDVQATLAMNNADVVLPAAAFVERDGTTTNWEGRRQSVNGAVDPPGAARADYAILAESARRLGRAIGCRTAADCARELEAFLQSAPERSGITSSEEGPRESRDGDALRLLTYHLLYDDGSRISKTGGVRELTQQPFVEISLSDSERLQVADGQQVTVASSHGSLTLPARVSKSIRRGVVFVPWNQPGASAQTLCAWDERAPDVTVEPA